MKKYIFIVCVSSLLVSCVKTHIKNDITKKIDSTSLMIEDCTTDYAVINTELLEGIEIDKYNEKIKSIKYIGLVSEEPIGTFYQLMIFNDKIYILDTNIEKIFIFNTDGKIIHIIDDKGGGPKEYTGLGTMCISMKDSCLIVSDRLSMHILYYSLDGNFIKKEKGIASCFIESYGNKIINQLDFGQSFSTDINSNFHLVFSIKDSILKKAFPLYPIQINAVVEKSLSYNSKGGLLCSPLYSDTVYQIINDSIYTPKYVFQQNKSLWSKNQEPLSVKEKALLIINDKYTCLGKPFLETYNFISYRIKLFGGNVHYVGSVNYYYDKTKKKSFYFNALLDSKNLPNYIPSAETIYNNYFVGYISPSIIENIREWGKTHELNIENEELRNLINSNDDFEGIIVMYELK